MTTPLRRSLVVAAMLAAVSSLSAQSVVIYRETFSNATAGNASINTVGWHANSLNGLKRENDSGSLSISSIAGRPAGLTDVLGVGNETAAGNNGLVFSFAYNTYVGSGGETPISAGPNPAIIWTEEFTVNRSQYSVDTISFYMLNTDAYDRARVALRIGGQWYVTANSFSSPAGSGGNFGTQAVLRSFTFTDSASAWNLLNFTPVNSGAGGALSIGAAASTDLGSGNITGFGLFVDPTDAGSATPNQNGIRFDTFTISGTAIAIPEPASAATALGAAMLAFVAGRRRASGQRKN